MSAIPRAVCAVFLVCVSAGVAVNVKKLEGTGHEGKDASQLGDPQHQKQDHADLLNPEHKTMCVCEAANMFACQQSCLCVPQEWRCDGDQDCEHGEDEHCDPLHRSGGGGGPVWEGPSDPGPQHPTEQEPNCRGLTCPSSGRCISREWLCDGDDDCGDFWDEASCGFDMNCTAEEFQCENGLCVQRNWVCDGDNDCKDFSDESNCAANTKCAANEFRCGDSSCISEDWRCDSESDCTDNSDEAECADIQQPSCTDDEFQCSFPRCVKEIFRCDGNDDCGDWSDEENCPSQPFRSCRVGEYKCNSGKCIPERWLCDDESDCDNGEDEESCEKKKPRTCGPDEFSCSHGNCILKTWLCDGVEDCPKGEDEHQCTPSCEETQFACSNSSTSCISRKHMCDGKKDCTNGEDEKDCPTKKECGSNPKKCEQICVTNADGKDGCNCRLGFTLHPNGYSCRDIDECTAKMAPLCSQNCLNTVGSFTCSCKEGYTLRSNSRSCKALGPPAILLFANRVDIRQMSLNNVKYTAILKGLHNAIALDYHYSLGLVYWSDVSLDMIRRAHINGSEPEDVIRWGLEAPSGVALDWVHNLLFWTDSGTRRVEVASLDGSVRSVLAASDLDKPRAIAVHPGEALVFWTDWGPNPKIESCNMDGSNRNAIVTESVFWPNGLTIDFAVERIYWADAKHHVIENAKFDGQDRKKIISKGLPHPFALTVFEDFVYWTDWHTKSISSANKITGLGFRTVHSGLHFPMDIHSYHPQRQPNYPNRCLGNNGGCSHLCLPNRISFTCVCPLGQRLKTDRKTCDKAPEKLLLFARSRDLRIHLLGGVEPHVDMVIPVDDIQSATALAWDSSSDNVFWADAEANTISRAALNGSNQMTIVSSNLESPAGISVDWVTNKLYWTDAGTNRIEVSNLDGTMRGLVIWEGIEKLRDIVVNPYDGYMYWSDWGEAARIEKAGMDGSSRRVLISQNITRPNGLAIDHDTKRLYWADGGMKTIEYSNYDGLGRKTLIGGSLPYPFGLAVYKESVYWTDWDTASIHRADKMTGKNITVLKSGITGLMDVQVFHRDRKVVASSCNTKNGGCSHLCLLAPQPKRFACSCPIGIKLMDDNKKCADGPTNSLIFAHRVDIRRISLDVPYVIDVVLPLPPMHNAVAVDVDRKTGEVYWSDTVEDVIRKAHDNGSDLADVVIDGLDNVEGIVIDSTGRKVYWTDGARNSIEVAELDGSNRKVIIWTGLDSPRAITLHYHKGLMFWSSWGKNPCIERAFMDGTNRTIIVNTSLVWPNGLAIDRPAGRLYWNDGKLKSIESSNLDGSDRQQILSDVPHPYGLVVVGSHLYWTDWQTEALHRADKENGAERVVIRDRLQGLMTIRSVQADNIAENACGHTNGGCSHLCLRRPDGFVCACPTGIKMGADGVNCNSAPQTYLLFATRSALARVSLDTPELWDVTLPIPEVHTAVAVDFHWEKQIIIYTDIHLDVIRRVNMNNFSDYEDIIFTNLSTPTGLAVDWIANNIYWTDTTRKVLEVARIDGTCRKLLIHDKVEDPRALTVFPRKGFLYWTEWGDSPKIERAYLDGSARRVIIGTELGFPNGLALDYKANRLFWADALRDRIETSDLHGRERIQLVPEATHPIGLTQFGPHVYWTDWYKKSVERADKVKGSERVAIRSNLNGVMEIRAVAADQQQGWTPCAQENGHCSHLCFHRPQGYICQCPDVPDQRTCYTKPSTIVSQPDEDSEDEEESGGEFLTKDHSGLSGSGHTSQSSLGVLLTVCILVLLVFGALVLLALVRRRYKHNLYAGRNVLTFANPNYNASEGGGAGGAAAGADRRPFLWKKLKYEKSGGPAGNKAASTPSSSHHHEEGIILCAVPEPKTNCSVNLHSIMVDRDFGGDDDVTTNVDEKQDEVYSEITVPTTSVVGGAK